jgi:hypothetical protein
MPITPVQLVGGSYTSRARSLDLARTINAYIEPGADKQRGTLIGTPGLRRWLTLTDRPVRGLYTASGSRTWVAAARSTSCSRIRQPGAGTLLTTAAS